MMQFVMYQDAPDECLFAEGAFDAQIGQLVPLTLKETDSSPYSASIGHARLVSAEIIGAGHVAKLTLEICSDAEQTTDAIFKTGLPAMSFGFKA
jgi:hypothetical protein